MEQEPWPKMSISASDNMGKSAKKIFWYWLMAVMAGLIILAYVFIVFIKPGEPVSDPLPNKPVVYDTLPEGYAFQSAPEGKLPVGFPSELVLIKGAEILRGEDTIDGTGANQKKVDLLVAKHPAEVFSLYQSQMSKEGWENTFTNDQEVRFLGFKKDNQEFYVTIVSKTATTSQVGLTLMSPK